MIKIPFIKMHGLGNDFVIIEQKDVPEHVSSKQLAIIISDRHLGIGCDQFIIYQPMSVKIKMEIYNNDGSRAMACGNASRCIARLLFDKTGKTKTILNINDREVICKYHTSESIAVDMGEFSFEKSWMPKQEQLWSIAEKYMIEPKEMLCVDVANPHLVIFSELSKKFQKTVGKNFQNSELFPDGVNVSFAKIQGDDIKLKVWERGAGFTHACGSGAIATFAAANKLAFVQDKAKVKFEYGELLMHKKNDSIIMSGPATYSFSGDFIYEG
ncbi:MAG: hypothetical protein DGJ47_000826 [Rickettsiaceae bacterium]